MVLPPAAETIQATLAPAFLISGTSVFLNFAQNRLFRVVDRMRTERDTMGPLQRRRTVHRLRLLRNGIALGVLTVAFTITSAILLMGGLITSHPGVSNAAPYCFAIALLSFFAALLVVFTDTVLSVRQVEEGPDGARGP